MRVCVGPMGSGKTTALKTLARVSLGVGRRVVILLPEADTRPPLFSRDLAPSDDLVPLVRRVGAGDGARYTELTEGADVVLGDEGQLLCRSFVAPLARDPRDVHVFGLDMNYLGEGFLVMPEILARAALVHKLRARCVACGDVAIHTARLSDDVAEVVIGDGIYAPRCPRCFFSGLASPGSFSTKG